MFTRGLLTRSWSLGERGQIMVPEINQWTRTELCRGGSQGLTMPDDAAGAGYAMDPSDPRTWRQPVRWT